MKILAIETSFDETAAAVVEDGTKVLSSVLATSSQLHAKYGGVLPELASREQLKYILPVITQALQQAFPSSNNETMKQFNNVDSIAVTVGPGLIGSLLIGVETAKTIAMITGKPIIPVNHVLAHIYANFVNRTPHTDNRQLTTHNSQPILFPAIALVVSGGHTELFFMESEKHLKWLGGTIDDAAGEAFDKTARLLGFGNRGGVAIQEAALIHSNEEYRISNVEKLTLPRPMIHDKTLNFSFSGLKTAVLKEWNKTKKDSSFDIHHSTFASTFSHEIQEAITDVLVTKTLRAAEQYNAASILVSGGVAANLRLREKFTEQLSALNSQLSAHFPEIEFCTDNAVTIGSYAFFRGKPTDWHNITASPNLEVEISE